METARQYMELKELLPLMEEIFDKGGTFVLHPSGVSMLPTIKEGRDAVLLARVPTERLKVGDAVLYRRQSGVFVLHRIVHISRDGTLTMRGDNQYYNEEGILPSQIIALTLGIYHGKEYIACDDARHLRYLKGRRMSYPLRRFFFRAKNFIRRRLFHVNRTKKA